MTDDGERCRQMARRALAGGTQLLCRERPDAVLHRHHLRPDLFAAPSIPFGGTEPKRTFVVRRADGEDMRGGFGGLVAAREYDIYGEDHLLGMIAGAIEAGGTVEEAPLFGPFQTTVADRLAVWERNADAFRDAYRRAWEARDWPAAAEAARRFRADLPDWAGIDEDGLRDSVRTIARNMRGEPHPPRWHIASRRRRRIGSTGIADHFAAERRLHAHLASLHALPGYERADERTVVPVRLRWTDGLRHVARAELHSPRAQFLHPVKPDGSPMPRARSFRLSDVAAIRPEKRTRPVAGRPVEGLLL